MKRNLLLIAALAITILCKSQAYQYVSFPTSNTIWSEKYSIWNATTQNYDVYNNKFAITGEDTLINTYVYKKLYHFSGNTFLKDNAICLGGLREDSLKRVYAIIFPIAQNIKPTLVIYNQEKLLYDFSLKVGDTLHEILDSNVTVARIDTIVIGGLNRKRFSFKQTYTDSIREHRLLNSLKWIEGIGCINNGLYYFSLNEFIAGHEDDENKLLCFTQNNQSVYVAQNIKNCFPATGLDMMIKPTSYTQIFPNPTSQAFMVTSVNTTIKNIKLYNITGQLVFEQNSSTILQNQVTIDVSFLNTGLYNCMVELANGSTSTQRIVKE